LQRAKRYPDVAREGDEQGVATVTFTMDRNGHILSASLVRSSGSPALDEEAVAMVHRADPLPPMPVELAGNMVKFTLPVTFSLR
jgi:protein TonB